jgi:hypothetical protein
MQPADLPLLAWAPPAKLTLFPSVRRRAFILKNAAHAARLKPEGATNWIGHILAKHRARLERLGADADASAADAAALEAAFRAELARLVSRGAA